MKRSEMLLQNAANMYRTVAKLTKEGIDDVAQLIKEEADLEMTASIREEMKEEGLLCMTHWPFGRA